MSNMPNTIPTPDQISMHDSELCKQVAAGMMDVLRAKDGRGCMGWFELAGAKLAIEEHLGEIAPLAGKAVLMAAQVAQGKGATPEEIKAHFEGGIEKTKRWLVGEEVAQT